MKNVLITGANGFIGKNLSQALKARGRVQVLEFTRDTPSDQLIELVKKSDFIYHVAGVNRPESESDFTTHNKELTERIISILETNQLKTPLLITSSIQATLENPYGASKKAAEDAVLDWHKKSDSPVFVYRLPGIFGKWSKPNYNSVVSTFCFNIANGLEVQINDPSKVLVLSYIDDVIKSFLSHLDETDQTIDYTKIQEVPRKFEITLKELEERIVAIRDIRTSLLVPNLDDVLNKFLYAAYISHLPVDKFDYTLARNVDNRGWLAEFVKSRHFGQVFISKTKPGITRGDHWHHTKIEKFFVVSGDAEITFRDKANPLSEVIRYQVNGDSATVVDIPTGYVHAITNIGKSDLVTIFWANEILDKENPDTYYEKVEDR